MADEMMSNNTPEPASNKNMMWVVVGALVLLLVGGLVYSLTSNSSNENSEGTDTVPVPEDTVVEPTPVVTTNSVEEEAMRESDEPATTTMTVEGGEFFFKPNKIRAKVGDTLIITLSNTGQMPHDFVIDEFDAATAQIKAGETDTIEFVVDQAGTFEFYCSVGQHRANGMFGELIVEE